jgi:broad specificity phosphatase PhoE
MTTLYLIRHSKVLKTNNDLNSDDIQLQNEKACLSIEGEELAHKILTNNEFTNIDVLFSSNYVRSIQTAKYLTINNNVDINIMSELGERKFGVSSWDELPEKFERKQFLDENYKI